MTPIQLTVELIGHSMAILTFVGMALYVVIRRTILRRTVRRAALVYWLVILTSVFFALANALRMAYLISGVTTGRGMALADLLGEYPSVTAQSIIILIIISLKLVSERHAGSKRILAIGAHPDDLEIACGGMLAKMRDSGFLIRGLIMTRGEQGGSVELRPEEARRAGGFLGLDHVQVLGLADTRLAEQSREVVGAIESQLREFQPDIILTHSCHDQHQDHQAVHEATLRAGRNHSTILCYESPSVTKEFIPSLFVDIERYVDVKVESIREHWDQRNKPYVEAERVRGAALFRGSQAKVRAAEGLEIVRALTSSLGEI